MREQDLNLAPQQWKDSAIKRGLQLRVCYEDKILLEARIAELEAENQKLRVEAAVKLQTVQALNAKENHLLYENQRLRELGGKIADDLDACRSQLAKTILGGGE